MGSEGKKFFAKKWYFVATAGIIWLMFISLTTQESWLEYLATFIASYFWVFVIWSCVLIIIEVFKYFMKNFKKKDI